jgi:hypothetical protein
MGKKTSYITKYLFLNLSVVILGSLLFFGLLWSDIFSTDALFLGMLKCLLFTNVTIILTLALLIQRYFWFHWMDFKDVAIISLLFFFGHYCIYGLIPFNTSRSVSVMIAGYLLDNKQRYVSEDELTSYVQQKYFIEEDAVMSRLTEQISIGNLHAKDGLYKITDKGIFIVSLMGHMTKLYSMKKNYAITTPY